jgi:hypothetical protein
MLLKDDDRVWPNPLLLPAAEGAMEQAAAAVSAAAVTAKGVCMTAEPLLAQLPALDTMPVVA